MPSHVYIHRALPARPQPAPNSNKHRTTATIFIFTYVHTWVCGRPFVQRFALCCRTVVCLSVLSVCNVGVLWPSGSMDQDETCHAGRPRPWQYCVRWGPSSRSPKKGAEPPIFGPCLLWPDGWMDQDDTWYGGRSQPRAHCARWGPSSPPKRGHSPQFSACMLWPNDWMDQDATW